MCNITFPERMIKQHANHQGYPQFRPHKEGKPCRMLTHRAVAIAFLPNPDNLPQVNHKDENPQNNRVDNLEWCTAKYNSNYGTCQKRHSETLRKNIRHKCFVVKQYDLKGNLINEYVGKKEIVEAGFSYDSVVQCCKHILRTVRGYVWRRNDDPFSLETQPNTGKSKTVLKYDLDGNLLGEYDCLRMALSSIGKKGSQMSIISRCCLGSIPSAFGYIWKYKI